MMASLHWWSVPSLIDFFVQRRLTHRTEDVDSATNRKRSELQEQIDATLRQVLIKRRDLGSKDNGIL